MILYVSVSATLAASVIAAQDMRGGGAPQDPPQMSMMRLSPILSALDANQDGAISAAELANAPSRLKTLDKNGDGSLTRDEAGIAFGGRGGRGGDRGGPGGERGRGGEAEAPPIPGPTAGELLATLLSYDKNKDGKLEKAEVPERLQGMFDRGDLDKNGVLDADELKKLAADQANPSQGGGERRGGGPGGPGGPGGGRGRGPGAMDVAFNALDTDHDGTISADEIAHASTSLKTLDRNNDGTITEDEVRPAGDGRGGTMVETVR
jgi:Ca2+-binding EF-hand superfamily protein